MGAGFPRIEVRGRLVKPGPTDRDMKFHTSLQLAGESPKSTEVAMRKILAAAAIGDG